MYVIYYVIIATILYIVLNAISSLIMDVSMLEPSRVY